MLVSVVQQGGGGAAAFINKASDSAALSLSFDELKTAGDAAVSAGQGSLVEGAFTSRDTSLHSGEEDTDDQAVDG